MQRFEASHGGKKYGAMCGDKKKCGAFKNGNKIVELQKSEKKVIGFTRR